MAEAMNIMVKAMLLGEGERSGFKSTIEQRLDFSSGNARQAI